MALQIMWGFSPPPAFWQLPNLSVKYALCCHNSSSLTLQILSDALCEKPELSMHLETSRLFYNKNSLKWLLFVTSLEESLWSSEYCVYGLSINFAMFSWMFNVPKGIRDILTNTSHVPLLIKMALEQQCLCTDGIKHKTAVLLLLVNGLGVMMF